MGYSLADIKTKALIYNTLEQKVEVLTEDLAQEYIRIISFDKAEEPYYDATVDLIMASGDTITKASIKLSNNYVEFFDCNSKYEIILNKKTEADKDTYSIKFVDISTANANATIITNTRVRKGLMTLDEIWYVDVSDGTTCKDVLSILPGYARALPNNYLTSVSGLTVYIDDNNDLIIS